MSREYGPEEADNVTFWREQLQAAVATYQSIRRLLGDDPDEYGGDPPELIDAYDDVLGCRAELRAAKRGAGQ